MIYEYSCEDCGNTLTVLQKMTDPPLTQCPACMNETLVKVLSSNPVHFKGSGFYATDYKNK